MRISIQRLKESNQEETVSKVYINDEFYCYGIEQPWADNKPYESCIPAGSYMLLPFQSSKYGSTYHFHNPHLGVTKFKDTSSSYLGHNRYACLIHSANWARQLQGCLGLGMELVKGKDEYMVTRSRDQVNDFIAKMANEKNIQVIITNENDWG